MTSVQQTPTFEDLELIVEISQLLTLQNLNTVMERVIGMTGDAVGAQKASLFLLNGVEVDWNHIFTARNLDQVASIQAVTSVLDGGLAAWVVKNRVPALVNNADEDDRWLVLPDDQRQVGSAMCIPFMMDGEVIAVLTLDHPETNHFTDYQLRLMTIITNQASVAIRNTQLFNRLLEQQRQLEVVLRSIPDVLLVTDEETCILRMNSGAAELMGLERIEDGLGQLVTNLAQGSDVLTRLLNKLEQNPIRPGGEISFEARSDRHQRDYAITVSRWMENAGKLGGNVVVMHDITTLRDLYRFKDEMLRIASHDLRTPLSTISGYADMVDYDIPTDSPLREYTEAIHRSVKRMNTLLEDLLQVRQIDEKGLNIEVDTFIIDVVRPVYQGALLAARHKSQTVHEEIHIDESVRGNVDPMLLRQAMENFASNAVKYTPEGGEITIRAYVEERRFFFEVQDNGVGIPEESLPHLFESFYRVNPRANVSINGAGLGLSLVKSIVERHHGEVWVVSEVDSGSLFGMWLPL